MFVISSPIDTASLFAEVQDPAAGAFSAFVGVVRDHDRGRRVTYLYYDCYVPMAEKLIEGWIEEATRRWNLARIYVRHRVGELQIGQAAVAIAVSAAHREEAFAACRFLIEAIKHKAPIWKKQYFEDGSSEWASCSHTGELSQC